MGGSIGAYATDSATPKIPFWLMVFKNIRLYFLERDDFPAEAKVVATWDLNDCLQAGWPGFEIGKRIPLAEIARAHELVEHPLRRGRVVVTHTARSLGSTTYLFTEKQSMPSLSPLAALP